MERGRRGAAGPRERATLASLLAPPPSAPPRSRPQSCTRGQLSGFSCAARPTLRWIWLAPLPRRPLLLSPTAAGLARRCSPSSGKAGSTATALRLHRSNGGSSASDLLCDAAQLWPCSQRIRLAPLLYAAATLRSSPRARRLRRRTCAVLLHTGPRNELLSRAVRSRGARQLSSLLLGLLSALFQTSAAPQRAEGAQFGARGRAVLHCVL